MAEAEAEVPQDTTQAAQVQEVVIREFKYCMNGHATGVLYLLESTLEGRGRGGGRRVSWRSARTGVIFCC